MHKAGPIPIWWCWVPTRSTALWGSGRVHLRPCPCFRSALACASCPIMPVLPPRNTTSITCWTGKTMSPGHGRVSGAGIESSCELRFPSWAASQGPAMNRLLLASAASLCFAATGALADEGMWTFDNFPIASVNQEYGLHLDQAWLDRLRGASVRLSIGCSASVVSADGLVLTNHH